MLVDLSMKSSYRGEISPQWVQAAAVHVRTACVKCKVMLEAVQAVHQLHGSCAMCFQGNDSTVKATFAWPSPADATKPIARF